MKRCCFFLAIVIAACNNKNTLYEKKASQETEFVTNDTIPEVRRKVGKDPVASYLVPSADKYLDYKFGVKVYETSKTFQYLLEMNYDGMKATDTLKVPNFGTWPVIQVNPQRKSLPAL